ncbi:RNA-binding protein Musashi 2 [Artemisia annua]|uniref:RNA-binding protein Musashi 2 n=1 Tax=Artemisia annua TaxID=35608 RepID=A0A2U1K8T1_ARTAN|nr:RNA-binding protein Musashi 2 [Artemisia annua]
MSEKKLVVLGIPWDVDTEGLREYMLKFGELEDCIVMKELKIVFLSVKFPSIDNAHESF